jgi:hypothetical protein
MVAFPGKVDAQGAFIRTDDGGEGVGAVVGLGEDSACIVVTVAHVFPAGKDSAAPRTRHATVLRRFGQEIMPAESKGYARYWNNKKDLAAIEVLTNGRAFCRAAPGWQGGKSVSDQLNSGSEGQMVSYDATGDARSVPLHLSPREDDSLYINVEALDTVQLREGMSGSPVQVNGVLVGVLRTIEPSTRKGQVLLLDQVQQHDISTALSKSHKTRNIVLGVVAGSVIAAIVFWPDPSEPGSMTISVP